MLCYYFVGLNPFLDQKLNPISLLIVFFFLLLLERPSTKSLGPKALLFQNQIGSGWNLTGMFFK